MNFSDLQRRERIRVPYSEPTDAFASANASRPRFWAVPFFFAVTLLCGVAAQAQTQPQAQAPPPQAQASAPQAQAPPPAQTPPQTKAPAQTPVASEGKTSGNYTVQQSIEFGYRDSMISGNLNNYNTFVNLDSGVRLLDYTLNMRSIDHRGIVFDDLSFSNFGYGGDPNNVSRLRIGKNKWYDFRALYRRDKNIWNYNLLANPLNPTNTIPGVAVISSPHALDLSRRMQD